jgi:hypothetical protein
VGVFRSGLVAVQAGVLRLPAARAHGFSKLGDVERLPDHARELRFIRLDVLQHLGRCSTDHDGAPKQVRESAAEHFQHLKPIQHGQHQVQHEDVRFLIGDGEDRLGAIARDFAGAVLTAKNRRDQSLNGYVIVDDEDATRPVRDVDGKPLSRSRQVVRSRGYEPRTLWTTNLFGSSVGIAAILHPRGGKQRNGCVGRAETLHLGSAGLAKAVQINCRHDVSMFRQQPKKETQLMKSSMKPLIVSALALLICVPAAFAQTPEASILPVTEPLDVGGTILQPGTYMIRVVPSSTDRNKVQVMNQEGTKVFASVLTVPHPLEPGEEVPNTTFVYYPAGEGSPRALRTWFAPNPHASGGGHDIVYDEKRAKQLARLANSNVVYYPGETVVAEIDTDTELSVVTPQATVETYTYVPPPALPAPPMTSATEAQVDMPATASRTPLIALLGLISLVGAVAFRMARSQ